VRLIRKFNPFITAIIIGFSGIVTPNLSFADQLIQAQMPIKQLLNNLTTYTKKIQKQWHVPGVAVAVVKDNKIIYAKGFGERNAKGQPVTPNTLFDIASLTKSFTAVMLGLQVDQGKYTWNTKVLSLYPSFKLYDQKTTQAFEIRDLIAHDSGLPADALDALGDFGYSTDHTLYALRYVKPAAPFRNEFAYQDIFLAVAKKIIEKSSGHSYTADIHQWIFKPLGMNRSFIRTEPKLKQEKNVAQPFLLTYQLKNYPYAPDSPYLSKQWALDIGLAGGGIHSTAVDLAKWLMFNMNNGSYDGKQLVSEKTMEFIHTPKTVIEKNKSGKTVLAYGEGWFIDNSSYRPYTLLYHSGGGTGMHAFMAYIPQAKLGMVVLTNNYTTSLPTVLVHWFFDHYLYGKPQKNWDKIYLKQRTEAIQQAKKATGSDHCLSDANADLTQYVGTYYNPVYGQLLISKAEKKLSLTIGPQKIQWQLSACKKNTLKAFWPDPNGIPEPMLSTRQDLIYFKVDSNGNVKTMTIPFLNDTNNGVFVKKN